MDVSLFDYLLPSASIAQQPAERRDQSRLLRINRSSGGLEDHLFAELPKLLRQGDLLILNDTKVIRARIWFHRKTGSRIEGLFLRIGDGGRWQMLLRGRGRVREGEVLDIEGLPGQSIALLENRGEGLWSVAPLPAADAMDVLDRVGQMPLPPYIQRPSASAAAPVENEPSPGDRVRDEFEENQNEGPPGRSTSPAAQSATPAAQSAAPAVRSVAPAAPSPAPASHLNALDAERYQTVYAAHPGAAAAPTAGLHFTPQLLGELRTVGVEMAYLTLHVGLGTFRPVAVDRVEEHHMHNEEFFLPAETVAAVRRAKAEGRRVVAVGTTSVRVLESMACGAGLRECHGETDIFIYPPFEFRMVDALITNFHLPRSTLLMLVAAFAGRELILRAYAEAVARDYRFYSYGDACLIE